MQLSTPIESETGNKFTKINYRRFMARQTAKAFVINLGFKKFRRNTKNIDGGVLAFYIGNKANKPTWLETTKNKDFTTNDFEPNNTPKGLKIKEQMQNLPVVTILEFNALLNIKTDEYTIGFDIKDDFYIFKVSDDIDTSILPTDCTILEK